MKKKKLKMSQALRKSGGKFPPLTGKMFSIEEGQLHACALGVIYSAIFPMPVSFKHDERLYDQLYTYFWGGVEHAPKVPVPWSDMPCNPITAVYTLNDSGFNWGWEQIATWLEERGL